MSILCLTARRIKRKSSRSKQAKMVLNVDLNELSAEARQAEESVIPAEARQPKESAIPVDPQHEHPPTGSGLFASPITADAIDDEVIFLTASEWPREARNQRKRKQPATSFIDENLETNAEQSALGLYLSNPPWTLHMEEFLALGFAVDEPVTTLHPNCQQASSTGISKMKAVQPIPELREGTSSSINEGTLICAVCMCRLNEPVSTNCGHIFCCACIEKVLQKQKKCPTCMNKLTKRSYHRIYLPCS